MKIEAQTRDDHQVTLTVELESSVLEKAKRLAAKRLSKSARIPGFRPGKAPYALVVRHVGETNIVEEAIEKIVDDIYPKVIEQSEITPYGPGSLSNIISADPPTFEFLVPLAPDVELGDYKSFEFPYELPSVTDESVQETLEALQAQKATTEDVDRPAEEGDVVSLNLQARDADAGEDEEPLYENEDASLVIEGEEVDEDEWPFPGFSRHFIGVVPDDEKSIAHTYAEDYEDEDFQGKTIEFFATASAVQSRELPELDDAFAQDYANGQFETLEALTEDIRAHLENNATEEYNNEYEIKITDELIGMSTVQYPPQMLDNEIDIVVDQLKNRLANMNMELDLYLKSREMNEDEFREDVKPTAEERLARNLVIMEVANVEKIQVSEAEVQTEVSKTFDSFMGMLPPDELEKLFSDQNTMQGLVSNAMGTLMFQKTLARMRAIASGEADEEEAEEDADTLEDETAEAQPEPESELSETAPEASAEDASSTEDEAPSAEDKAPSVEDEAPAAESEAAEVDSEENAAIPAESEAPAEQEETQE